tara:strand:+ start:89 stop:274 length:186 start_codon:yes stop_codon:yes gene_type:complete
MRECLGCGEELQAADRLRCQPCAKQWLRKMAAAVVRARELQDEEDLRRLRKVERAERKGKR